MRRLRRGRFPAGSIPGRAKVTERICSASWRVPVRTLVLTGHHGIVGREQTSHETEADVRLVIDALGRKCPVPIIMLAEQIGGVLIGEVIAVLADDPAAFSDVPAWAAMKSHDLAFRVEYQTGWAFGIRRNY